MPMTYEYDPDRNLVNTRVQGVVTIQDMLNYVCSVLQDTSVRPGFIEVADCEGVEDIVVSFGQLRPFRQYWQEYVEKGCRATLIYTPTDFSYGVFHMVQSVIVPDGNPAQVPFELIRTQEELAARIAELEQIPADND